MIGYCNASYKRCISFTRCMICFFAERQCLRFSWIANNNCSNIINGGCIESLHMFTCWGTTRFMTNLCVSDGNRSNTVLSILTNASNYSIIRLFNCCVPCILHRTFSWSTIDEMKYICRNWCGSFGVGTIEPCK